MATVSAVAPEADLEAAATCPLCHTRDFAATVRSVAAGAIWRCHRCGQMWSADRLNAVARYARFREDESDQ